MYTYRHVHSIYTILLNWVIQHHIVEMNYMISVNFKVTYLLPNEKSNYLAAKFVDLDLELKYVDDYPIELFKNFDKL